MFMNSQPAQTRAGQPQPEAPAEGIGDAGFAADVARLRAMVSELVDMAADIARTVHREALAEAGKWYPGKPPGRDYVAAFDKIARTIRRTILLLMKLAEPPAPARIAAPRAAAGKPVLRVVEDDRAEAARPRAELDRLERLDQDEEIGDLPVGDIIDGIRRDLGLAPVVQTERLMRRTPNEIAALRARAAEPGEGLPDTGEAAVIDGSSMQREMDAPEGGLRTKAPPDGRLREAADG